jgi:predicted TIM-barrel fold metal-dependent hydrolase
MGVQRELLQYNLTRKSLKLLDSSFHKSKGEWNPWYRKMLKKNKSFEILQIPDNDFVFETVNKYQSKFYGWLFLNPVLQNCNQEFEYYKKIKNLIGFKLHPFWHRYNLSEIDPIIPLARSNKLPILLHLGYEDPNHLINLIRSNYDVKFILSHCAFPFYNNLLMKLKNSENTMVDLSSHHVSKKIINNTVKLIGSQRCLFGVDDPYGGDEMASKIINWISDLDIDNKMKENIFFRNFINLYEKKI